MRTNLLFLLLASAPAPALAADEADDRAARREAARAERSEAAAETRAERRSIRSQPSIRLERSIVNPSVEPGDSDRRAVLERRRESIEPRLFQRRPSRTVEAEPARPMAEPNREPVEPRSARRRPPRFVEVTPARPMVEPNREPVEPRPSQRRSPRFVEVAPARPALEPREGGDSVREWRSAQRQRDGARRPALVEQRTDTGWEPLRKRPERRIEEAAGGGDRTRVGRAPRISRVPVEGTQPPAPLSSSRVTTNHWRGDWRSDHRYDWRKHRRRHGWLFHFGFYSDPFGWRYRPYSIGWRLWPSYYHSRYWLHDAWTYRLPYAPPGYRWIRYYDDALLVDTWDGRVVDVIRDFFW